jgi:endonuclease/exonuclease/phosphatase family metal-dependent hydrolase
VPVATLRPLARLVSGSVTLLALLLCAGPLAASPSDGVAPAILQTATSRSFEFVVLTYNIRSLPMLRDADRMREIGRILADRRRRGEEPDVVLLQEAFSSDAERIRSRAGYRYQVLGNGKGQSLLLDNPSGLEILSDYPIVTQYGRRFDDCAGADCFVTKSVIGATLAIPGLPVPLRIFTTHLQSQTPNDAVRKNQIDDIDVFLRRIGFGAEPAIFAGDLNFKPRHLSYQKFVRVLPFFTESGRFCLDTRDQCEIDVGRDGRTDLLDVWKSSNDRQFFYTPKDSEVRITPIRLIRNFTEHYEGARLSDHYGYEVRYRFTW